MRLDKVKITKFKNIIDLCVDFDQGNPISVVIGNNGSAKSNFLEAIIMLFRNVDLSEPIWEAPLKGWIRYQCRDRWIEITADSDASNPFEIRIDNEPANRASLIKSEEERLLPTFVFGYYSGTSTRMERLFDKHQERFYDHLISTKPPKDVDQSKLLRPFFYARLVHSQFVLLAFLLQDDENISSFLRDVLRIEGVESILFVMRQPDWNSKEGDSRFWNARGEVREFLSQLFEHAYAPLRLTQDVSLGFRKRTKLEHLYLMLPDLERLRALYSKYGRPQEFFKALESTYISQLLQEVRIRVKIRNSDDSITFRELSEGEQQLLVVIGLLRFTHEDESLFLLDEPDTHLNPAWSRHYLRFIEDVVGDLSKSHIVMTTHNPLVFSSLERQQVHILLRNEATGAIRATRPEEDPRGMGVTGMLLSDMFRLPSAFDLPTEKILEAARRLDVLADDEQLTTAQREDRRRLQQVIERLDISISSDRMQNLFIRSMGKAMRQYSMENAEVGETVVIEPDSWQRDWAAAQAIAEGLLKAEEREYLQESDKRKIIQQEDAEQ